MAEVRTCAKGHQWTDRAAGDSTFVTNGSICPICTAKDAGQQTVAEAVAEADATVDITLALDQARPMPPLSEGTLAIADERAAAIDSTVQVPASASPDMNKPTLRAPSAGAVVAAAPLGNAGTAAPLHVEGYELLQELGRGGMGVVYKARQLGLNRIVALKMILAAGHASPQSLRRFRAEAEAIAQFQHPNIVQIYEVGEQDGKPYFSLEYVDGGCLADKIEGIPQPPKEAAKLLAVLADAMDSAHRRGIIHRDLKPANILLTADAQPKITDFGLAKKFDEDSGQTREGAIMGTPSYMAPEQAEGKSKTLGPSADIYSLGAILYDLATGRPPFRGDTLLATLQAVKHDEPVAPSRLQPKMPRDLETICLKCLDKDPKKRYLTAAALADDVRRFLSNEPIRARPIGTPERVWKWTRRHRAAAALIGVSALALLLFAVGGVWVALTQSLLRRQAEDAEAIAEKNEQIAVELKDVADQQRAIADEARKHSDRNFERATAAVDTMLTKVGRQTFAYEPRMAAVRRDLLDEARRLWLQFLSEQSDNAAVKLQTGKAYKRLGDVEQMMGDKKQAAASYEQALTHLDTVLANEPDNLDARYEVVVAHSALGSLLRDGGQREKSRAAFVAALQEGDKLLKNAAAKEPRFRQAVLRAHSDLAIWYQEANQSAEAEKHFRAAIAVLDKLVAEQPGELTYQRDLGVARGNLANYLQLQRQPEAARKEYDQALRILAKLAADHHENPDYRHDLYRYQIDFGVLLVGEGKLELAQQQFADATAHEKELADSYVDRPEYRFGYGWMCRNSGSSYYVKRDYEKAAGYFRDALRVLKELVEQFPGVPDYMVELSTTYASLAETLQRDLARHAEALEYHKQALALREQMSNRLPNVPLYVQLLAISNYGLALCEADRPEERRDAERHMREAIRLQKKLVREHKDVPAYRLELGRSYANLGTIQMKSSNVGKEPESNFQRAFETWTELPASTALELERADARRNLAILYSAVQQKFPKARELYLTAIKALGSLLAADPENLDLLTKLAECQKLLAGTELSLNEVSAAEQAMRECIRYRKAVLAQTRKPADRTELANNCLLLLDKIIISLEKDPLKALELVKEFSPQIPDGWKDRPVVARLLARCIPLAEADPDLGSKKNETIAKCADEVVKLLRKAVADGTIKSAAELKNADLDPVRDHPEFKKLLAELEAKPF